MKRWLASALVALSSLGVAHADDAPASRPTPRPVPGKVIKKSLCGARKPCQVSETLPAGQGAAGEDLAVYKLALARDPELECERFEYWLLSSRDGKLLSSQPLLEICNDGYGVSGVGDDSVTVKDNHFGHGRSGGSAWRWFYATELQLSPLRVKREDSTSEWTLGPTASESFWSWDDFRGEVGWFVPECDENGGYQRDAYEGLSDAELERVTAFRYRYAYIPVVSAPADFAAGGWADAALGRCALDVDGSAGHGYTTFGKPGGDKPASDSSFRTVLLDADTLLVEVHDDKLVGPGKKWLLDDHLELWLAKGDDPEGSQEQCLEPAEKPRQWGIRIADGKVFAAAGKPQETLAVTRREVRAPDGSTAVRFKIQLPPGHGRLTLVYSDSDDGKKQERLIATSQLGFGKTVTLGARKPIAPGAAVCEVVNGRLEPRQTQTFAPGQTVLGEP